MIIENLKIIDVSDEGKGIGKNDSLVLFVDGCTVGDEVSCEITKKKKRYAFAKLVEITKPSPYRVPVEEICPYKELCGGCLYDEIQYDEEASLKLEHGVNKLVRIGQVEEDKIQGITAAGNISNYRNKATMAVSTGGNMMRKGGIIENLDAPRVGFFRAKSHDVVDCSYCKLQSEAAMAAAEALRIFMEQDNITAYDERWEQGLMRHLVVKTAFATGEVMVILVINGKGIPNVNKLIEMLDDAIYEAGFSLESIYVNINKDKNSLLFGKEMVHIAGKKVIEEVMGDLHFEISPQSFYQVNPEMTVALYDQVKEYVAQAFDVQNASQSMQNSDIAKSDMDLDDESMSQNVLLDLYCGVGSIGLWCADCCDYIVGIESVKDAVVDANRNAVINGIINARYICEKAEIALPEIMSGALVSQGNKGAKTQTVESKYGELCNIVKNTKVAILDPPRKGCHPELKKALIELGPEHIVYVSCDAATLARDIVDFREQGGYEVVEAKLFDMFPRTKHVECVVLMTKHI